MIMVIIVVWGLGPAPLVGLGHGSTSSPDSGLGWVWVDEINPPSTLSITKGVTFQPHPVNGDRGSHSIIGH